MTSVAEQLREDLNRLIKDGEALDLGLVVKVNPQALEELRDEVSSYLRTQREPSTSKQTAKPTKKAVDTVLENMVVDFRSGYESWYSEALAVLGQVVPDRVADFKHLYKQERRKDIDFESYTLADYQIGLVITRGLERTFNPASAALRKFRQQLNIVKAARKVIDSRLADIRGVLQADLFDSELDAARELLKNGYLRASGVVAGVVLERHLAAVSRNHKVTVRHKAPTIRSFQRCSQERRRPRRSSMEIRTALGRHSESLGAPERAGPDARRSPRADRRRGEDDEDH